MQEEIKTKNKKNCTTWPHTLPLHIRTPTSPQWGCRESELAGERLQKSGCRRASCRREKLQERTEMRDKTTPKLPRKGTKQVGTYAAHMFFSGDYYIPPKSNFQSISYGYGMAYPDTGSSQHGRTARPVRSKKHLDLPASSQRLKLLMPIPLPVCSLLHTSIPSCLCRPSSLLYSYIIPQYLSLSHATPRGTCLPLFAFSTPCSSWLCLPSPRPVWPSLPPRLVSDIRHRNPSTLPLTPLIVLPLSDSPQRSACPPPNQPYPCHPTPHNFRENKKTESWTVYLLGFGAPLPHFVLAQLFLGIFSK